MRILKSFTLQSVVVGSSELFYLKDILNKADYVEILKLRLDINMMVHLVDAKTFREYFLPDRLPNLRHLDFVIACECAKN